MASAEREAENPECVEWLQKWQQQPFPVCRSCGSPNRGALIAFWPTIRRAIPNHLTRSIGRLPAAAFAVDRRSRRPPPVSAISSALPSAGVSGSLWCTTALPGTRSSQEVLACLLFTSAAWKMAPRDTWIGWSEPARRANLSRVVNNARFLILPWVECRIWPATSWLWPRVNSPPIGWPPTVWNPCCWRPWWTGPIPEPVIVPPTGSAWARPKAAAAWIVPIPRKAVPKTSCCTRWSHTGAKVYASFHPLRFAMLLLRNFMNCCSLAFHLRATAHLATCAASGLRFAPVPAHASDQQRHLRHRPAVSGLECRLSSVLAQSVGLSRLVRSHLRSPGGIAAFRAGSRGSRSGRYAL
jgi:hypothetical protein